MHDRAPWLLFVCSGLAFAAGDGRRDERADSPATLVAHDLGVEVLELEPLFERIPKEIVTRVAKHSAAPAKELERVQLLRGVVRTRDGVEHSCDVALVPLAGAARGGRVTLALENGRMFGWGVWGAHDFDDDPTGRWGVFQAQFTPWPGEPAFSGEAPSTRETETLVKELSKPKTDERRLARALLDQRLAMRKNGFIAGLYHRKIRPLAEWFPDLERAMERVAESSDELVPLLREENAGRHAEQARALAEGYAALGKFLAAQPEADLTELEKPVYATCSACHDARSGEHEWTALVVERRAALGLDAPALQVDYDLAPALGDDGGEISRAIAEGFRNGVLLLEASR